MNLSNEIFPFNHQTLLEIDNALIIVYYVIDNRNSTLELE